MSTIAAWIARHHANRPLADTHAAEQDAVPVRLTGTARQTQMHRMGCTYGFGPFRLDPATRELHHGDTPVAVPPRAFDVLVYLIEHRERAVGRDELIAAVWGRTEIGDGMLGQTILSARRALEDTGKEQHFIRTVIRFGYHWIAPVSLIEAAAAEAMPASMPPAHPEHAPPGDTPARGPAAPAARQRAPRRGWLLAICALLVLASAALITARWRTADDVTARPPLAGHARLALVLPVQVNAGSGHDWVRLGGMELIAGRLRTAGLAVVPSDNVVMLLRQRAQANADPARLATAAGASLVVATRADALAGVWRVTLQTSYGSTPPIHASSEAGDVLAAARLAADEFARALGLATRTRAGTEAPSAQLAMLLGQVDAAILNDHIETARALIHDADAHDREQPEVRLRVAQIDYQAGDFAAAERGFEAVAQAVPAEQDGVLHARALTNLGVIAAMRDELPEATQRIDAAIAQLRTADAPDALGKALNARGNIAGALGRYDDALQYYAEARIGFDSAGNVLAGAVLDGNLANIDRLRLHFAEAERGFTRAADRFAVFGMKAAEINALTAAAELQLALLQPDAALALEPRLRELIAAVADPARQRAGELTRLQILAANGRQRDLDAALRTLLQAAEAAGDHAVQAGAHALLAELALERGDGDAAAAAASAAAQQLAPGDDARTQARTRLLQVRAALASGQSPATALAGLVAYAQENPSPAAEICVALARAIATADGPDAATLHQRALDLADASQVPQDLRDATVAYATWLIGQHDLARAASLAERLAGSVAHDYPSALLRLRVYRALGNEALTRSALERVRALAGDRVIPADLPPPDL